MLCSVCLTEPKTHLLVPCGHKCLCAACAVPWTKAVEDQKANQMWSFEDGADGSGNWKKFDSETAARLERAYMANAGPFTTTVGGARAVKA